MKGSRMTKYISIILAYTILIAPGCKQRSNVSKTRDVPIGLDDSLVDHLDTTNKTMLKEVLEIFEKDILGQKVPIIGYDKKSKNRRLLKLDQIIDQRNRLNKNEEIYIGSLNSRFLIHVELPALTNPDNAKLRQMMILRQLDTEKEKSGKNYMKPSVLLDFAGSKDHLNREKFSRQIQKFNAFLHRAYDPKRHKMLKHTFENRKAVRNQIDHRAHDTGVLFQVLCVGLSFALFVGTMALSIHLASRGSKVGLNLLLGTLIVFGVALIALASSRPHPAFAQQHREISKLNHLMREYQKFYADLEGRPRN